MHGKFGRLLFSLNLCLDLVEWFVDGSELCRQWGWIFIRIVGGVLLCLGSYFGLSGKFVLILREIFKKVSNLKEINLRI